mmetsp:Transcript_33504/g.54397  ORF Transcript_33504/g.54397 Transcript_33504/m.54397 type:complete len:495 (-) Transcript_33504:630-2114(-)
MVEKKAIAHCFENIVEIHLSTKTVQLQVIYKMSNLLLAGVQSPKAKWVVDLLNKGEKIFYSQCVGCIFVYIIPLYAELLKGLGAEGVLLAAAGVAHGVHNDGHKEVDHDEGRQQREGQEEEVRPGRRRPAPDHEGPVPGLLPGRRHLRVGGVGHAGGAPGQVAPRAVLAHHQLVHDRVPGLAPREAEQREERPPEGLEVGVRVQLGLEHDGREEVDAQHREDEEHEEDQCEHVEDAGQLLQHHLGQRAQRPRSAHQPEQEQHARHPRRDRHGVQAAAAAEEAAPVRQPGPGGEGHHAGVEGVPPAAQRPARPVGQQLQRQLGQEGQREERVRRGHHRRLGRGLACAPQHHDQCVGRHQRHHRQIEAGQGHQAVGEGAGRVAGHSPPGHEFRARHQPLGVDPRLLGGGRQPRRVLAFLLLVVLDDGPHEEVHREKVPHNNEEHEVQGPGAAVVLHRVPLDAHRIDARVHDADPVLQRADLVERHHAAAHVVEVLV